MKSPEQFDKTMLPAILSKFSARIQRDLATIEPVETGEVKSAYLYGKVGSGKTLAAIQIMIKALKEAYVKGEYLTHCFIPVPEMFIQFKKCYDTKGSESDLIDAFSNYGILVLDDLGTDKTSEWAWNLLYVIINRRYENMLLTIFTSNLDLKSLADKLSDDRIPSRIQRMGEIIEFIKSYTND